MSALPEMTQNERHKEYIRAVKETKLDHIFSKPFVCSLDMHSEGVQKIAKSPVHQDTLASVSYDGEIHIWNIGTREVSDTISKDHKATNAIAFFGQDFMYSQGTSVFLRGTQPGSQETEFSGQKTVLDLSANRASFFAATVSGIEVYSPERIQPIATYSSSRQNKRAYAHQVYEWLVMGVEGNTVLGYDTRSGECAYRITAESEINALSIHPSRHRQVVVALNSGDLKQYNLDALAKGKGGYVTEHERIFRGHVGPVLDVQHAASGHKIISGSTDKTIRIFHNHREHTQDNVYHNRRMQAVTALCCTDDGNYIVSGSTDTNLRVWKVDPNRSLKAMTQREKDSRAAGNLLKEKYSAVQQISNIRRHKILPRVLKQSMRNRYAHVKAEQRKAQNLQQHSTPKSE